jgi:hypothetical protein
MLFIALTANLVQIADKDTFSAERVPLDTKTKPIHLADLATHKNKKNVGSRPKAVLTFLLVKIFQLGV